MKEPQASQVEVSAPQPLLDTLKVYTALRSTMHHVEGSIAATQDWSSTGSMVTRDNLAHYTSVIHHLVSALPRLHRAVNRVANGGSYETDPVVGYADNILVELSNRHQSDVQYPHMTTLA